MFRNILEEPCSIDGVRIWKGDIFSLACHINSKSARPSCLVHNRSLEAINLLNVHFLNDQHRPIKTVILLNTFETFFIQYQRPQTKTTQGWFIEA